MEEKAKKIVGFLVGYFSLPIFGLALFWASMIIMTTIGKGGEFGTLVGLAAIALVIFMLRNVMNVKFFFMGVTLNILSFAAFFLVFLGACAEHPFMGSANPGAGVPFYIAAIAIGIFTIVLFGLIIRNIARNKPENIIEKPIEPIREYNNSGTGMSKLGLFWIGFAVSFGVGFMLGPILSLIMMPFSFLLNNTFNGLLGYGFMGIVILAVISIIAYAIFKDKPNSKYFFLGFFTWIALGILWAGSCFGVIMIGSMAGNEGAAIVLAMIASVVIPILALIVIAKRVAKASKESQNEPQRGYREVWDKR